MSRGPPVRAPVRHGVGHGGDRGFVGTVAGSKGDDAGYAAHRLPSPGSRRRMTLAGTPAARLSAGTSEVTTEPSAITLPSPMVTPGKMVAPVQIQTSSPMLTGLISDGRGGSPSRRRSRSSEWPGESKIVTPGAISARAPMLTRPRR